MGTATWKLTHFLTTFPKFFYFFNEGKEGLEILFGEGFSKEKGRKTVPKEIPKTKRERKRRFFFGIFVP